ncbi:hypothetical protein [Paenibacillus illinoisensis]|nr:hypothetical protein [Paenibacillus illinoisensis]
MQHHIQSGEIYKQAVFNLVGDGFGLFCVGYGPEEGMMNSI